MAVSLARVRVRACVALLRAIGAMLVWRWRAAGGSELVGDKIRRAFRDKAAMEEHVATTQLEWIAVRPGILTNGQPRGTWRVAAGSELVGGKIGRADVAAFMLQQATSMEWVGKRPTLVW